MQRCDVTRLIAGSFVALSFGLMSPAAHAQATAALVTRGFDTTAAAIANGEERQRQPDLHVFEVQFKPVRMLYADVTNPQTGDIQRQQIWYLCYRAVNRSLATRADETDTKPVNVLDPLPGPTQFIPEFTLVTYDGPRLETPTHEYLGEIVPEALAAINQSERRRASDPVFLDSVSIVQPLPQAIPAGSADVEWIYGVAVWPNVDPETDYFKVVMRGFSNGYEQRQSDDGETVTWRKTLVQNFARRGDRFDPNQIEFEIIGPPEWVYLPDLGSDAQ